MQLTGEICGAAVDIWSDGSEVVVRIGDLTASPAEIEELAISRADWVGTVEVGGFLFSDALSALKRFVAAGCLAAEAERASCD